MKTMKVKVTFDENSKALLTFISDTREGKYTKNQPVVENTYGRMDIQESHGDQVFEESTLLYGIF